MINIFAQVSLIIFVLGFAYKPIDIEIQYNICGSKLDEVMGKLSLAYPDGVARAVYFFDDADHRLSQGGIIFRLRKTVSKNVFTVKIRNVDPAQIPVEFFDDKNFKCEVDKHGEKAYTTCSLNSKPDAGDVEKVLSEQKLVDALFSDKQKLFARNIGIDEKQITAAKPNPVILQRVWKFALDKISDDVSIEHTMQENIEQIELSVRVAQPEASRVEIETLSLMKKLNLNICASM